MSWARYLVAVAVGLAIGVAGGWLSNQASETSSPQHKPAPGRATTDEVDAPSDGQATPPVKPPSNETPPGLRRVQQLLERCLYATTTPEQISCLQEMLELERQLQLDDPLYGPIDGTAYG